MTEEREKITFRLERWRAVSSGLVEPLGGTFFLLIAIRFFHAGDTAQAFAATGGSVGLLLGPPVVSLIQRGGWPINRALAVFQILMAIGLLVTAWSPHVWSYVMAGMFALTAGSASIPLSTQFYQQNYPPERRGTLFSISSTIRLGVSASLTWAAGHWLENDLSSFRLLVTFMSVASLMSARLFWCSPGDSLVSNGSGNPFKSLGLLRKDKKFLWLIMIWMLFGFGNLMMTPLRVKFLVEPKYGFMYSESDVALLVGVIPALIIFSLTWWWGRLFDRINFFVLRTILNTTFLISNLFFFLVGEYWGFLVGMIFLGISFSGGNVAWSLWVTKLAPPDKVADYMSVHTFTTGLRGVAAPMLGVYLAKSLEVSTLVGITTGIILVSILMLGPELTTWRKRRSGHPVSDGMSE